MRLAAWGTLSCVLAMGLADFTQAPQAIHFGALTILGWMVWYLLAKAFPAHLRSHKETIASFLVAQKEAREDFKDALKEMGHSLDCMAATVAGIKRP